MPTPNLPPEILAIIFELVSSTTLANIDLLSCCLVCRSWYRAGVPFVTRTLLGAELETPRFDNDALARLTNVFRDCARYGLNLGGNGRRLLVQYGNLVCFENRWDADRGVAANGIPPRASLDHTRAYSVGQLILALQDRMHTLSLNMHNSTNPARLKIFDDLQTSLGPGFSHVTTLRITLLSFSDRTLETFPTSPTSPTIPTRIRTLSSSLKRIFHPSTNTRFLSSTTPATPPHPIISLIRHLSTHLERFHLSFSDFTPTLSLALRSCPRIHSIWLHSIRFELPPGHLAHTIASWPKLRTLSIRNQYTRLPLTGTVAQLARFPPPLTVLELHDLAYDDQNPTLASLITACADKLIHLALPRLKTPPNDADTLIAYLATLHLPRLRVLDLNSTAGSFSGQPFQRRPGDAQHPPFPWPELREIRLDECWSGPSASVANDFVGLAIRSCPLLERVSLPVQARNGPAETVKVLEENGFVVKPWARCWLGVRGEGAEWEQCETADGEPESNEGVVVNM